MRNLLQQLKETQGADNNIKNIPSASREKAEAGSCEQDMIQTTTQLSSTFHVTPNMFHMNEIEGKTLMKDLAQIQSVMTRISNKALYKLQVSVAQEVQSCTCIDAMELQQTKDNQDTLELVLEQSKFETKDEKDHVDRLD
jgi:hypothetical protein